MLLIVTRRAKAYQITIHKRQIRPLVIVLNVVHCCRLDPAPVSLAPLAHIPIAAQDVLALFQPAFAGIEIYPKPALPPGLANSFTQNKTPDGMSRALSIWVRRYEKKNPRACSSFCMI